MRGKQYTEYTEKSPRICAYLLVFFLSHEWARTEGRASQFTLMPSGVELSHADGADLRGTTCGAKFCVSVWKISRKGAKGAKRYVLLFLCQKYCTQITQNHADALRNFAPLREKKICPFVLMSKKIFHTELTEYTEFLLRNSIYFFVNRLNSTEWHRILCLTEVLNWRPQNESKNNNFSNICISSVYEFVI